MKTIVLVKQVLDPAGISVRRDKERVFINKEDYILGAASKAAIEAALQLKCGAEDHTLVALSLGEPRAEDALREALAMGCDEAYLLSDKSFTQADTAVAARVLAAGIARLGGANLVVAGRESGDTGSGQLGPRLAAALGYAQVTDAWAVGLAGGQLEATRRWAEGYAAVQCALPAVVTVAPEAFPPRLPHGARIMNAYRAWGVTTWTAADLGLAEEELKPLLTFRAESFPPPLEVGEVFRGEPASVARDVVMALRLQKLIGG